MVKILFKMVPQRYAARGSAFRSRTWLPSLKWGFFLFFFCIIRLFASRSHIPGAIGL